MIEGSSSIILHESELVKRKRFSYKEILPVLQDVTSEMLLPYCGQNVGLKGDFGDLPGSFRFPFPFLCQDLYDNYKLVPKYASVSSSEVVISDDMPIHERYRLIQRKRIIDAQESMQGPGERGQLLLWDKVNAQYGVSEINFGKYHMMKVNLNFYQDQNLLPMLEFHTHPNRSFFSAYDFQRMLWGKDHYIRGVQGAVVLLPDRTQLLALATNQTPQLPLNEVEKLVDSYMRDNVWNESEQVKKLKQEFLELDQQLDNVLQDLDQQYGHLMRDLLRKYKAGELTDEEFDQALREHIPEEVRLKVEATENKVSEAQIELAERISGTEQSDINNACIQFARDNNIKFYSSNDMETFTEFSA